MIGTVGGLARYPVKSMAGEALEAAFLGFSGVYGDRLYAIRDRAADPDFPYLTGREKAGMLLYRPRFRDPARAAHPGQLAAATSIEPTLNVSFDEADALSLDVETPAGDVLAIDDPGLLARIAAGLSADHVLTLMRSESGYTDCRPVSIISRETVARLGEETGAPLDARRFRANIVLDMPDAEGFAENAFLGATIRVGDRVEIKLVAKDPRCKMIALNPDTAKLEMKILRHVARVHGGFAGLYGVVIQDGLVRVGDDVALVS